MNSEQIRLLAEFNEAKEDYKSYLADPYVAGSDEDNDSILELLLDMADRAIALSETLCGK